MVQQNHRLEHRTSTSTLAVAVQSSYFYFFKQFYSCQLIDICHGGVSFSNKRLKLKIGKKINLSFYFENKIFDAQGLVVRVDQKANQYIYGIMFIDAPIGLDKQLDVIIQHDEALHHTQTKLNSNNHQRKDANRLPLYDSQIFVKRISHADDIQDGLLSDEMIEANVVNISRGGIAFVCEQRLSKSTPFHIQFRISNLDSSMQITGLVHYTEKRGNNYFYGVEFKMVPMEFIRLLDNIL